jgi:hypothetical protein
MALKPRWVVPLNFRAGDKPLLDDVVFLAKKEDVNVTDIIRDALIEYTGRNLYLCEVIGTRRIDEFLVPGPREVPLSHNLTPEGLKSWEDADVLAFARTVKARKQELEFELKRRGYYFQW